ncbi:type II toxin-antitoxin system VapB family antitoxin [Sphingomonas panni]|uniref:type II toxin-antitoxin system VapB family antitoxin n=1 Tax=Sphingomonas panni TaxID=237612 RepID=UPI001F5C09AA|nr:type II toxin-antitoxin system VapB family antitoxin [Sphingomonas panni]
MASLYIKDPETAAAVARVAKRLGTSKTQVVRDAIRRVEDDLEKATRRQDLREWMREYREKHPLPPPTGLKADKAFYDWLSGEEDDF